MDIVELHKEYPGSKSFKFGDGPELCQALTALVRCGKKVATCGALRDFGEGGEPLPVVGRKDIVLNWDGSPALVIETLSVAFKKYCEVDEDFALAEGENDGLIKILMNKKGKVIGVQIVSYHAGDLIAEWIPILNGKVKLSTLTDAIHPYPTMSEINKNASVNYLVSTIPPWTKKLTKMLFGYQGKA